MAESNDKKTPAENLEEKFDRGEDVLDYFDVRKARLVDSKAQSSASKKYEYRVKRSSQHPAVVREKSARYPRKTA